MDCAGDWICCVLYCRVGSGRVVHALGQSPRLCAVCNLPDSSGHRPLCLTRTRSYLISMETELMSPDLQSCVLCEDVRCEFNGMQTLVGVINVIAAPSLPINYLRLCIWTRWCSG